MVGSQTKGYHLIYLEMDSVAKNGTAKPQPEYPYLIAVLREVNQQYTKRDQQENARAVAGISSLFNVARDACAMELIDLGLKGCAENDNNAQTWIQCKWEKSTLPDRVAITADEVSDIDGRVASVRQIHCREGLAKHSLELVVARTGVEAIRYEGRVGSNPDLSRLIRMKQPRLDELRENGKISDALFSAIGNGLFCHVMGTNARTLFKSVIPILSSPFYAEGSEKMQKGERTTFA